MLPRERVFAALNHQKPDRCPVDYWAVPEVTERLCSHFSVKSERDLYDVLDVDLEFVFPEYLGAERRYLEDGTFYDHMGTHRRIVRNQYCVYKEYASSPLGYVESLKDFERYDSWPDASRFDWAGFSAIIGERHKKRCIKLHTGGLFEYAWALRGYERFMMDLALDPEIPHFIMDKLCNYWCDYVSRAMAAAGDKIDIVYTYDDIASQNSLLVSLDMLEEFVFPYHRKLNGLIHDYGKKILYHTCGAVRPVIGNLADLPIDVLNPLQPMAKGMDFKEIKRQYGDRLCFHGGICLQSTLPYGKPDDVRAAVRHAVSTLGENGGYIMTSAHYMQNDIPTENIIAMYELDSRH